MNRHDLYQSIKKLAPYEDATEDYRASLSEAFQKMENGMKKIKDIAKNAYHPLHINSLSI